MHFDAIARAIATIDGENIRKIVCDKLVPVMQEFNTAFDAGRFRHACKVGPETLPVPGGFIGRWRPSTNPPDTRNSIQRMEDEMRNIIWARELDLIQNPIHPAEIISGDWVEGPEGQQAEL